MRILLIGASGRLGAAVHDTLKASHDVVTASRARGEVAVDIRDPASIRAMYQKVGRVDAVACTAGWVPFKPLSELSLVDMQAGVEDKLIGQLEVVRQGTRFVTEEGSFSLITGILARRPIRTGVVASLVNGALESFVMAAARELPSRQRINAVSPTVFSEALDDYGAFFPGFLPVPLSDVAATYLRSIEGIETGSVFELGD